MQSFRNQYELRRGKITLYQRSSQGSKYQSDNWHARFNITGHKAIRKSLKTCDQYEAEQIAEDLYQHLLQKTKRGLALSTKRFGLVCNSYVENLKHHSTLIEAVSERSQILSAKTYKSRIDIVERFIAPQLGDKNIDQMTDRDIEKYVDDRKTGAIKRLNTDLITYERNGKKVTSKRRKLNPSHSTINKDLTVLRAIFEYARKQGLIDSKQIPDVRNVRKPKNYVDRKPDLTHEQYLYLRTTLENRIFKQRNRKHKHSHRLLHIYIVLLATTGMRVTEAKRLRFSDFEQYKDIEGTEYVKISVEGKGKARELIALTLAGFSLERIKTIHRNNARKFGWELQPSMSLFLDEYGKPISFFRKALDSLLQQCDLLHDKRGNKRNAGAFRKYYITDRLINGVNPIDLAKNCGTSIEVMQRYYDNLQPIHAAKELTRTSRNK